MLSGDRGEVNTLTVETGLCPDLNMSCRQPDELALYARHVPSNLGRFHMKPLGVFFTLMALLAAMPAVAQDKGKLYEAKVIVTGTGETNRSIGFRKCLDKVLLRVSGDQRILKNPRLQTLRDNAGKLVAEFRYRDRLEGVPIHDEQGTHDRPHDLTCIYRPEVIDRVLASLGSKPWLGSRPELTVFLVARNGARQFLLTRDGAEGPYMRDSFEAAAEPLAMTISFPSAELLKTVGLTGNTLLNANLATLDDVARKAGGDRALVGSIVWSDKDLGWIANWRIDSGSRNHEWKVKGVSFDEAFRVAIKGAARILSGNGEP